MNHHCQSLSTDVSIYRDDDCCSKENKQTLCKRDESLQNYLSFGYWLLSPALLRKSWVQIGEKKIAASCMSLTIIRIG